MSVTTVRRDSTGASMESFSRLRMRRNAMGNIMQGVRPHQLRMLSATLNHVAEHDRNKRVGVEPDTASNVVAAAENHYGLAAVLGFPLATDSATSSASRIEHECEMVAELTNESSESGYSSEESERILRSPIHKRRRNAVPDALAELDEESIHRIRRLRETAAHDSVFTT